MLSIIEFSETLTKAEAEYGITTECSNHLDALIPKKIDYSIECQAKLIPLKNCIRDSHPENNNLNNIEAEVIQLALRDSVLLSDTESIVSLVKCGANPNWVDENGENLLHLAFRKHLLDDKEALKLTRQTLIQVGTNNHHKNLEGYSPTMLGVKIKTESDFYIDKPNLSSSSFGY